MDLKPCHCCDGIAVINCAGNIFARQNYVDRYPEPVASQNHGYQVRCEKCGLQTCWWHYEDEAITAWNTRPQSEEIRAVVDELKRDINIVAPIATGLPADRIQSNLRRLRNLSGDGSAIETVQE